MRFRVIYLAVNCLKKTKPVCVVDPEECKRDEISPQWYKIAGIGFFYVAILLVGVYATKQGKKKRRPSMDLAEDSMVAGRNIGVVRVYHLLKLK